MKAIDSVSLAWRIRRRALDMTSVAHASHIAPMLSAADILAVLYGGAARLNPLDPKDPGRDRVILSKGHACAAAYAALAETGFFDPSLLASFCADGGVLSGHASHRVPGVEFSTGSLGHGLPAGAGMALTAKRDGLTHRVFVVCGDGECDEGSVWEAALIAAHHALSNLVAVIDHNKMQGLGYCENTVRLQPFRKKWEAFGWRALEAGGHDHAALKAAFASPSDGRPTAVIAHTVKGKGVSFMENNILWHYRDPQGEDYYAALRELEEAAPALKKGGSAL